jgi:hypothetical protein
MIAIEAVKQSQRYVEMSNAVKPKIELLEGYDEISNAVESKIERLSIE